MSYTVEYDSAFWYPVPAEFPTDPWASPADWLEGFVSLFVTDLGEIPADGHAALREFGSSVLAERSPDVSEALIFCPRSLPVLGVANILVSGVDSDDDVDLEQVVVDDDRAVLPPTVEAIMTDRLGTGARAATVIDASDEEVAAGAFTYAFRHADQLVVIGGTADRVSDATAMLPFLDELVRGIAVEPE